MFKWKVESWVMNFPAWNALERARGKGQKMSDGVCVSVGEMPVRHMGRTLRKTCTKSFKYSCSLSFFWQLDIHYWQKFLGVAVYVIKKGLAQGQPLQRIESAYFAAY